MSTAWICANVMGGARSQRSGSTWHPSCSASLPTFVVTSATLITYSIQYFVKGCESNYQLLISSYLTFSGCPTDQVL